jgi:plexin A
VILYNCAELADSCSSCLGSEFECRWCGTPNQPTGSCAYSGPGGVCNAAAIPITTGSDCAVPNISDFSPKYGPPEGGTTITITGTDLGISFNDFNAPGSSIRVGGVACTPTDPDGYVPGRRISCITTSSGGSTGPRTILITLPNGAGASNTQFNIVSPEITGVFPSRGPQAGGTKLTVYGTNLDIGNTENTRITLVGGTECTVK